MKKELVTVSIIMGLLSLFSLFDIAIGVITWTNHLPVHRAIYIYTLILFGVTILSIVTSQLITIKRKVVAQREQFESKEQLKEDVKNLISLLEEKGPLRVTRQDNNTIVIAFMNVNEEAVSINFKIE